MVQLPVAVTPTVLVRMLSTTTARRNHRLHEAINRFIVHHNQEPIPFTWKADPKAIIAAAKRGHQTLRTIHYDLHRKEDLEPRRELQPDIAAGLDDVAERTGWNNPAPADSALPTETWREHVARRQRYAEVSAKLAAGQATSIDDLIT